MHGLAPLHAVIDLEAKQSLLARTSFRRPSSDNNPKKAFPFLLELFIADWQTANGKDQKPTFYITYDASLRPM
jgi:hypothetical protein